MHASGSLSKLMELPEELESIFGQMIRMSTLPLIFSVWLGFLLSCFYKENVFNALYVCERGNQTGRMACELPN